MSRSTPPRQPPASLLSRLLTRLRALLRPAPVDRSGFADDDGIDRRTIMLPMIGNQQGKSYYEVSDMWARERLRAKRHLQEIIDGVTDYGDPAQAAGSFACDVGVWLRFVDLPGMADTLDDLRMWHDHWHQELARLIDLANQGQRAPVVDALKPGRGAWSYAGRRVNQLLESLWMQREPMGMQLRLQGSDEWLEAALLRDADGGLTVSLERMLPTDAAVLVRHTDRPDDKPRAYRVRQCRPGQRGASDEGVFIAYLG
jgi:hypothetical protein